MFPKREVPKTVSVLVSCVLVFVSCVVFVSWVALGGGGGDFLGVFGEENKFEVEIGGEGQEEDEELKTEVEEAKFELAKTAEEEEAKFELAENSRVRRSIFNKDSS